GFAEEGNRIQHVLYRSGEGAIIELFSKQGDPAGWRARDLTAEARAPKAAGNPRGYILSEGIGLPIRTQHVVYRGSADHVYEVYGDKDGKWGFTDLTTATKAPKAANDPRGYALSTTRTQHVVYRAADGKIYELYNTPEGAERGWHMNDLTAAAKQP